MVLVCKLLSFYRMKTLTTDTSRVKSGGCGSFGISPEDLQPPLLTLSVYFIERF
jgi:hypothetical protein